MPVTDSMPRAAIAMPYRPANVNAPMMASASTIVGRPVEYIPTPRPEMMLVAAPVTEAFAMPVTGAVWVAV